MPSYRFGNRPVTTYLALRELPLSDDSTFSVHIAIETNRSARWLGRVAHWQHDWRNADGTVNLSLARLDRGYLLRFPQICEFLLDFERRTIHALPDAGIDAHTLEHLLVDQVLPRFLAHEGELLIHASALTIGDRTALFLGSSGWGKSTLAGLLHREGHALLSDDCVLLRVLRGDVLAIPTYSSLRLLPDSLDQIFPSATGVAPVATYSEKRRLRVPIGGSADGGEHRVDAIYLLTDPSEASGSHSIVALRSALSCIELIRNAFQLESTDRKRITTLLAQCSAVAREVPAFILRYPRDFEQTSTLTQMVTQHLNLLSPKVGAALDPENLSQANRA